MQFLEKLWKMLENIEILNLSQQKKEEILGPRTKLSYYKVFYKKVISNRNKKVEILMNKPLHLGFSILELSKISMYEYWYDYAKPKYGEKVKLGYMDTDSFIVYIKTEDIYKDIAENVETRFDTSNYELECNSKRKK